MAFTFHLVIPDASGSRVLLVEDDTGWALPRATGPEPFLVMDAAIGVRERFALDIALLRSSLVEYDKTDERSGDAFFFSENLSDRSPGLGEWCSEEAFLGCSMSDERGNGSRTCRGGSPERWSRPLS